MGKRGIIDVLHMEVVTISLDSMRGSKPRGVARRALVGALGPVLSWHVLSAGDAEVVEYNGQGRLAPSHVACV